MFLWQANWWGKYIFLRNYWSKVREDWNVGYTAKMQAILHLFPSLSSSYQKCTTLCCCCCCNFYICYFLLGRIYPSLSTSIPRNLSPSATIPIKAPIFHPTTQWQCHPAPPLLHKLPYLQTVLRKTHNLFPFYFSDIENRRKVLLN